VKWGRRVPLYTYFLSEFFMASLIFLLFHSVGNVKNSSAVLQKIHFRGTFLQKICFVDYFLRFTWPWLGIKPLHLVWPTWGGGALL